MTRIDDLSLRKRIATHAVIWTCWICFPCAVCHGQQAADSTRGAEFRSHALNHEGDPLRGRAVFQNEKAACGKCHSIDASHKSVGPDLFAIGNKFDRADLITSVLEPSKSIAIGFGTTIVLTKSGAVHLGVLQRVTDDWIELLNQEGKPVRVDTSDIEERRTATISMMPLGLESLVTVQEFTDLIAYLATLRQSRLDDAKQGTSSVIAQAASPVELIPILDETSHFDRPVWFGQVPGQTNTFVVLEHHGKAYLLRKSDADESKELLLDLTEIVRVGGATGLLGMAFHPQFKQNQRYFIKYQVNDDGRIKSVIEERRFTSDKLPSGDADAAKSLLKITGSTQDHNGGCLTFGPDGFLYIGMGDSGPQRDPQGHGQDLKSHLGKILRIDVDRADGPVPYAIPADNPLRDNPDALPEIWAYGFREPWRFSFDSDTGDMWVGDVGQDRYEEVAIVRAGENHGWNVYEGFAGLSDDFRQPKSKYVSPVFAYPRRLGVSVTGGHVYRGSDAAHMRGWYICGDFESRRIWALRQTDSKLSEVIEIGRSPSRIVSFAEDSDHELYLVGYDNGLIYRMNLGSVDRTPLRSRMLVDTSQNAPIQWRYAATTPPGNWTEFDFDDTSWKQGPGGFGTSGTPGARVRTDWKSKHLWLRRTFDLPGDLSSSNSIRLLIHHDEDAVVYLNGVEAARLSKWTSEYVEVSLSPAARTSLRPGANVIAIECRQVNGGQYIDAGLIEYLSTQE